MRLIASMAVLLVMLWATAFAYASVASPLQVSTAEAYSQPTVLCLNHGAHTDLADVSITPVYDWVHAGQQGINVTVTNKTSRNMVVDWDGAFNQRRSAGELAGTGSIPPLEPGSKTSYDVIAPGATFSRTLWPRSGKLKAGIVENRRVYLNAAAGKGTEQREEILLDVSGETRICSR